MECVLASALHIWFGCGKKTPPAAVSSDYLSILRGKRKFSHVFIVLNFPRMLLNVARSFMMLVFLLNDWQWSFHRCMSRSSEYVGMSLVSELKVYLSCSFWEFSVTLNYLESLIKRLSKCLSGVGLSTMTRMVLEAVFRDSLFLSRKDRLLELAHSLRKCS